MSTIAETIMWSADVTQEQLQAQILSQANGPLPRIIKLDRAYLDEFGLSNIDWVNDLEPSVCRCENLRNSEQGRKNYPHLPEAQAMDAKLHGRHLL